MAYLERKDFIQSVLEETMDRILCEIRAMHNCKVQVTLRLQHTGRVVYVWASGKNFIVRITEEGNVHIELTSYNPRRSYSEQIYSYEPSENSQEKFFINFRQQIIFLFMIFLDDWWGHFGDYLLYLEKVPNLDQAAQIMQYEYYLKNGCSDEYVDLLSNLKEQVI